LASAGVSAVDGELSTAWTTAFGSAQGAVLDIVDTGRPLDSLTVRQPVGDYSLVTELTLTSGAGDQVISVAPSADGSATVTLDPPIPAGNVRITITGIEPRTTIDRRYADVVELPAAISEIESGGTPIVAAPVTVAGSRADVDCTSLLDVDGAAASFRFTLDLAALDDAPSVLAEPCGDADAIEFDAGTHRLSAVGGGGFTVDQVVLSDTAGAADAPAPVSPSARVVDDATRARTILVDDCPDGCWLVYGEGFNEAWSASVGGADLGEPVLVDGGFNGWWLSGSDGTIEVRVEWTRQGALDIALGLSALGALAALALALLGRPRRNRLPDGPERATPDFAGQELFEPSPRGIRYLIVLGGSWFVLAGLLVAPVWALTALPVVGAALLARRRRLPELVALVLLALLAANVVAREYRNKPPANGAWPAGFDSLHHWAVLAVVAALVAAVVADDAPSVVAEDERDGPSGVDEQQEVGAVDGG
jgi:arabinofuranan 3-O-arabinosyltransferase